jgi:hypothetical protein
MTEISFYADHPNFILFVLVVAIFLACCMAHVHGAAIGAAAPRASSRRYLKRRSKPGAKNRARLPSTPISETARRTGWI